MFWVLVLSWLAEHRGLLFFWLGLRNLSAAKNDYHITLFVVLHAMMVTSYRLKTLGIDWAPLFVLEFLFFVSLGDPHDIDGTTELFLVVSDSSEHIDTLLQNKLFFNSIVHWTKVTQLYVLTIICYYAHFVTMTCFREGRRLKGTLF